MIGLQWNFNNALVVSVVVLLARSQSIKMFTPLVNVFICRENTILIIQDQLSSGLVAQLVEQR